MLRSRMNESDEFNKELIEAVKQICCKLEITPNFLKRESYWYALMDRWSKLRNPRQNWEDRDQKTLIRQGLAYVADGKLHAKMFMGVAQNYPDYLSCAKALERKNRRDETNIDYWQRRKFA